MVNIVVSLNMYVTNSGGTGYFIFLFLNFVIN